MQPIICTRSTPFENIVRRFKRRGRGLSLLEVALSLAIMAVMMAYLVQQQAQSLKVIQHNALADRMSTIVAAAATYVHSNYNLLSQDPASGGVYQSGGLAIPILTSTGSAPSGLTTVQAAGLLPSGYAATNSYGQREWLLAIRTSTSPVKMDFLVVTEGGRNIADGDLPWIAAKTGAAGGFVSGSQPYDPLTVTGAYGGWSYDKATWVVGGHSPSVGHLAATLAFTDSPVADYLYRVAVPGHPEANQMYVDLDMSGGGTPHSITGVGNINTQTMTASASITDNGPLSVAGMATFGGDILSAGVVSAQDFIINNLGGTRASEGVYNVTMAYNGGTITKPSCPVGKTAQIFLSPSSYSDNGTGGTMSAVQSWATDNVTSWTVQFAIRTETGFVFPDSAHGAALVMTKCG